MAIANVANTTGTASNASSITLTSWTPAANDLILLAVETRGTTVTHNSVAGNGLTWTKIAELNATSGNIRGSLWRAQGASPTTDSIVVTLSGAPATALAVATRFSGVDTTTPVEASATASSAVASTAPTVDITTLSNNAWAFGAFFDRTQTFTVGSGETAILINTTTGTSGNKLNISTERQAVATPQTVTIDGAWGTAVDWIVIATSLKEAAGGAPPSGFMRTIARMWGP